MRFYKLLFILTLQGTALAGLRIDDSHLAPAGYDNICQLPTLEVFDVTAYGARGNGTADDTAAIRKALAAAAANSGGIVYLPSGTYNVCPQPGDAKAGFLRPIFQVRNSKIVFLGDGPGKSILSGYCPQLKDPKTDWTVTGDGYFKIQRFTMFDVNFTGKVSALDAFQVRSLTLDGNAGHTGNSSVGGIPATGDGWDLTHKAIALGGSAAITNVLLFNAEMCNWRGEVVYSGAANVAPFNLVNCEIYGSNSSAVSVGGCTLKNCRLGGLMMNQKVVNGIENYVRNPKASTRVLDCVIQGARHGLVHLGLPGTSLLVDGTRIEGNHYGILFSEVGSDCTISNCTFVKNTHCAATSILGLYKNDPTGFGDFDFNRNVNTDSGALLLCQFYGTSKSPFPNLWIRNNSISGAKTVILEGGFQGGSYAGFALDNNTLGSGSKDVSGYSGHVGRWTKTNRLAGSAPGVKVDDFSTSATTRFEPLTDLTLLNAKPNPTQYAEIGPGSLSIYATGFTTRVFCFENVTGWTLKADPQWNSFSADVPVTPAGVNIVFTGKVFELVP